MLSVSNLLHHLSLVSFIEILLIENQQYNRNKYGTVMVYIEFNDPVVCDLSDRIVQTVSSLSFVPVILSDCDQPYRTIRRSDNEQYLNVILFNNRSSIIKINKISNGLFANDAKIVILVNDSDASLPYSNDFVRTVNCLNRFVLIGRDSVMVAFRLYRRTIDIKAYKVDMFDKDSVVTHFHKVYGQRLLSLSGKEIRVFVHYGPPWSLACQKDNNESAIMLLGPDVLVTEFILFHLNATIVMTTDIAIEEPDYEILLKFNLRVRLLHKEIFSDSPIIDFNARYGIIRIKLFYFKYIP